MTSDAPIKTPLQKRKKKSLTLIYLLILIGILIIGFIFAFTLIIWGDNAEKTSNSSNRKINSRQRLSGTSGTTVSGKVWHGNTTETVVNLVNKSTSKHISKVRVSTTSKPFAKKTTVPATTTTVAKTTSTTTAPTSTSTTTTTVYNPVTITAHNIAKENSSTTLDKVKQSAAEAAVLSSFAKDVPDSDKPLGSKNYPLNDAIAKLHGDILGNKNILRTEISQSDGTANSARWLPVNHTVDSFNTAGSNSFGLAEEPDWLHVSSDPASVAEEDGNDSAPEDEDSDEDDEMEAENKDYVDYDATTAFPDFGQSTTEAIVADASAPVVIVETPKELLPYHEFKRKFLSNTGTTESERTLVTATTKPTESYSDHSSPAVDGQQADHNFDFVLSVNPGLLKPNKDVEVISPDKVPLRGSTETLETEDEYHKESYQIPLAKTTATTVEISTGSPFLAMEEDTPICAPKVSQPCLVNRHNTITSSIHFPTEQSANDNKHFGGVRPIHYNLNLTVHKGTHTMIHGDISIILKIVNDTSAIFVNVGRSLSELNNSQISVSSCSTGRMICATAVTHYFHEELLMIELEEVILKDQMVVLQITDFRNVRANDGVIVQAPYRRDPKQTWAVVSFFQFRKARSIFPCIDVPTFKATLNLCVAHPKDSSVRSNTEISNETEDKGMTITCFKKTPKMSTYLYAFAVYDRLQSQIVERDLESRIPELEILYPRQMHSDKPSWMRSEAAQAIRYMEEYTGYAYPMEKLTLLATPLPVQGMENFGLILLNEKWVEYPMFAVSHTMLAHEIVHQWIGNIVTINIWDELCLQEGLSSYIGYKVNEATAAAKLPEAYNKIGELQEKRLRGIEKDSRTRMSIIGEFQTYEDALRCFDKPVLFFEMLSDGFGTDIVKKFTRALMKKYAFKNAGLDSWEQLVSEVAGTKSAGKFLRDFFTRPGIPLLRAEYKSTQIKISQTVAVEGRKTLDPPFVVPIVASQGSSKPRVHLIINDTEQTFPFANTEPVILDPDSKSYAVIIYEAAVYTRLLRCLKSDACDHVDNETVAHILKDFCWAFLNDQLTVTNSGPNSLKLWRDLTKELSTSSMVHGTCACCMDKKLKKSGDVYCKWHWKDHCEGIQLVKEIQRLV